MCELVPDAQRFVGVTAPGQEHRAPDGRAHSPRALGALRFAVAMARRARIRKRDVLNARPPDELAEAIRPRAR